MWDAAHMSREQPNAFQVFLQKVLDQMPKTRNFYDTKLQELLGTKGKPLYDAQRKDGVPKRETLKAMAQVLGQPLELFERAIDGEEVEPVKSQSGQPEAVGQDADDDIEMVGIQHIDLAYGLGATFVDGPVDIEVLQFPQVWVRTITRSPAELLTWSRGRGDSMAPTIHDGDLVLLDRSQTHVLEQDALWAFTVGDVGAIKRLRVKGDRYQILSDNPSVPADEEPIDFVNIVARVVFVGKRT